MNSLSLDPKLDFFLVAGRLPNLHSVVVLRHGESVFERYLAGPDEAWGRPLGSVAFRPDTLRDPRLGPRGQ